MRTDFYIARRYLVARKSLGVIHAISTISAVGMAIGTAAMILILSVYNGFDRIIDESLSDLSPDVLVTASHGKYFVPEGPAFERLLQDERILRISSVLEEEVFVSYDGREDLARAKGVDRVYEEESQLAAHAVEGTFSLYADGMPQAAVGAGLARKLGLRPHFVEPLVLYYPRRGARIPLAGPAAALGSIRLRPGSTLSFSASVDEELILLPLEQMRTLLGLADEVSGIELTLSVPASGRLLKELQAQLGPEFRVLDRYRQQGAIYKMMRYEKMAIFLILFFVIIIIATNIYGSLSMLAIEKHDDMQTLRALGADGRLVRRIFIWEGCLVSLCGLGAGVVLGLGLALLQQHLGLVKMPGNFAIQSYPVVVQPGDLLWTVLGIGAIGFLIALLAAPGRNEKVTSGR